MPKTSTVLNDTSTRLYDEKYQSILDEAKVSNQSVYVVDCVLNRPQETLKGPKYRV